MIDVAPTPSITSARSRDDDIKGIKVRVAGDPTEDTSSRHMAADRAYAFGSV